MFFIFLYVWLTPTMICMLLSKYLNFEEFMSRVMSFNEDEVEYIKIAYWLPILNLIPCYVLLEFYFSLKSKK